MASEWFYKRDDKQVGPLTPSQIKSLATDGTIGPDSLLRKSDSEGWIKASKIKGLFAVQSEEPPQQDPLIAMGASAAASVASAAGSAANAIGGMFTKKDSPPAAPVVSKWSHLTTDGQVAEVLDKLMTRLSAILMADEDVRYVAVQAKPMVIAQDCIVLTTKRFIFYRQKLLGRVDFEDYVWRELRDAKLSENFIGATITIQSADGKTLAMDYLPKAQARQVYRMSQEMEERSLEERRARTLEEKRAASGAVVVNSAQTSTPAADSPMARLKTLKEMADAGLISAAEFESKKADILSRM